MPELSIVKISAILLISVIILFREQLSLDTEYVVDEGTEVLIQLPINAGGHVYPYTATVVSLTCMIAIILIIICLGSQLE